MSIDKFGRYNVETETSSIIDLNTPKIHLDNCLKKLSKDIESRLNLLNVSQNQLFEINKEQANAEIKHIENQLKEFDVYKEHTNLSIFNLKKNSTVFEKRRMKQDIQTVRILEKNVDDLEARMNNNRLKKH